MVHRHWLRALVSEGSGAATPRSVGSGEGPRRPTADQTVTSLITPSSLTTTVWSGPVTAEQVHAEQLGDVRRAGPGW